MNDHAFHIEHHIAAHGGLAGTELPALHRTINSLNGYVPPIDAARAAYPFLTAVGGGTARTSRAHPRGPLPRTPRQPDPAGWRSHHRFPGPTPLPDAYTRSTTPSTHPPPGTDLHPTAARRTRFTRTAQQSWSRTLTPFRTVEQRAPRLLHDETTMDSFMIIKDDHPRIMEANESAGQRQKRRHHPKVVPPRSDRRDDRI